VQHHEVLHRVCPEHIHITDNAIIPEKKRAVDAFSDPLRAVLRRGSGKNGIG
jgi:succinate dehydrogenase / fumarate reductase iron-sulfur subunit